MSPRRAIIRLSGFDPAGEPEIRVQTNGSLHLVFNFMPPADASDRESLGAYDHFDRELAAAIGMPVVWEDRETFIVNTPDATTRDTLQRFVEGYRRGAHRQYVRITAMPHGDAPDAIRAAWIGLTLPLCTTTYPQPRSIPAAKQSLVGDATAYVVDTLAAVAVLASTHPSAAAWWRENRSALLVAGGKWVYPANCCVETLADDSHGEHPQGPQL